MIAEEDAISTGADPRGDDAAAVWVGEKQKRCSAVIRAENTIFTGL